MKLRILSVFVLLFLLVSCGTADATTTTCTVCPSTDDPAASTTAPDDTPDTPSVYEEKSALELLEMMRQTVEGEELTVFIDPLALSKKDDFKYHFFVDVDKTVTEAAICQPTNGVTPFFLGILKTSSEKAAEDIADEIADNINYRKLICTSFEKAHVTVQGKTVLLVLDGDAARADRMLSAFNALAKKS